MGRRSRKRGLADSGGPGERAREPAAPPGASAPAPARRTYRARRSEAPPAPWAPFPLVELAILAGLIAVVVALVVNAGTALGKTLLVGGFALIGIASLELALREHLAGYRSHTTLLAGAPGVLTLIVLGELTPLPRYAVLVAAAIVFGAAWRLLRALFLRRGGLSFRV
jgi:hypothetical protein